MNDVRKKALWMSLLGFALGLGIGVLFHALAGMDAFLAREENRSALLLYYLLSGLYGAANMGSSALYGIENWSILRCTLTHFCICVGSTAAFFGAMIRLGWMSMPPASVCALTGAAFVAVYCTIWLAQYLSYRRKVKKMNAALREWKKRRDS